MRFKATVTDMRVYDGDLWNKRDDFIVIFDKIEQEGEFARNLHLLSYSFFFEKANDNEENETQIYINTSQDYEISLSSISYDNA